MLIAGLIRACRCGADTHKIGVERCAEGQCGVLLRQPLPFQCELVLDAGDEIGRASCRERV